MTKKRDSFIFYRSFFDSISELKNEEKGIIFDAICRYGFDNEEIKLTGICKAIFVLIKPQLDANRKRFENGCSKKKNKQNRSKTEAKQKQVISKPEANVNVNVNVNENVNLNEKEKDISFGKKDFEFEEFWKSYKPIRTTDNKTVAKGSKLTAKRYFDKILTYHTLEEVKSGLKRYLAFCEKNNQLTCQVSVFLNQKRFLDYQDDEEILDVAKKQMEDALPDFLKN